MENQEQENTKPKAAIENPKPTDDVQLTIETVTPDTACAVPKTPVKSEGVTKEVEEANRNEENEHTNQNVNTEEIGNEKRDQTTDDAEEVEDNNANKEEGDDERDQIETVAP